MKKFLFAFFTIIVASTLIASEVDIPNLKLVGNPEPPIIFVPLVGTHKTIATPPASSKKVVTTSIPARTADMHKHKCPRCGTVWEHGSNSFGNTRSHNCPDCGTQSWYHYNGPAAAKYREGVLLWNVAPVKTSAITLPKTMTQDCPTGG